MITYEVPNDARRMTAGVQGENEVREFLFDVTAWRTLTGGTGTAEMIVQRPGDVSPYAAVVTMKDQNTVSWVVTGADTEKSGVGHIELMWSNGDQIVKSRIVDMKIDPALDYDLPDSSLDPWESWMPDIINAAAAIQDFPGTVAEAVGDWLEENLEPTEPPVDDTLSIEGAAADAKAAGDAVAELNEAIDTIGNVKSGTVVSANNWENFPFKFEAGVAYTFYNLSTATVSVRSRVVADEMTGDGFGTFGPNTATVITPTMDANYIRINSTAANTNWKVSKNDTEIGIINANIALLDAATDELSNIKLDKSVWENNLSATATTAGTYINFPYRIEKDHIYEFLVLDSGNTMSAYTRATESGANIDVIGTVAFGTKQVFTASANANYVRVNSYLSNGKFSVKDTGSASYQIEELEPKAPVLNLPKKLYAVTGKELNIYFDNICENSNEYRFDVTCTKGRQMERGFQITPVDTDAGSYTLKIDVYLDEDVIASAESSLIIKSSNAGSGNNVSFILMGDSTVNSTDTQIVANFADDAMTVTSKGTRGTSPALHEGRTGWTFQYYYNSAEIGGISNAFYNPSTHLFDASYYFSTSGVTAPDWFFIQLGINDMFLKTDDAEVYTQIKTCITQCNAMIASLKSAEPSIKIGIAITIPPNRSQDAFGKAYGCGQTRDRYKRNNMMFVNSIIETYGDRETDSIYLVPIYTNLDTTYNMGLETTPVNARNTAVTYESPIANGGVHPAESGYKQLADVYMAFLKAQA